MKRLLSILAGDVRNILRDRMLAVMPAVPFLAAVGLRFLFPFAARILRPFFDLNEYEPYLGAFFLLLGPAMMGFVVAFLFLDENEDGILSAVSVSPLGLARFAVLRFGSASAIAFTSTLAAWPLLGVEAASIPALLVSAATASLCAPGISCLILAFARNKVEGLTISKLAGFALLAPLAIAVIPEPWHRVAAVFPTWWVASAFLGPGASGLPAFPACLGGVLASAAWVAGFGSLARKRIAS